LNARINLFVVVIVAVSSRRYSWVANKVLTIFVGKTPIFEHFLHILEHTVKQRKKERDRKKREREYERKREGEKREDMERRGEKGREWEIER
jgi:hypothetical protein